MIRKYRTAAAVFIILAIAISVLVFLKWNPPAEESRAEPLKVTLLKVGKADAIVVQTGENTMIIDAGEEEDGEELVTFLSYQGISYVDSLIITHFDQDHVGGADTLVESMNIGQVLVPAYQGDSTEYTDFVHALNRKGISPRQLTQPVEFKLGEADVLVEPPRSYQMTESEMDNNFSLITTITHGDNRLLFTGDAEKQRIREWIEGGTAAACNFLKVPHHGVYNTALQELIDATEPQYAVICSSDKNPADVQTLELLKQNNIQVFQTKDGDVTMISDGSRLELQQDLEK